MWLDLLSIYAGIDGFYFSILHFQNDAGKTKSLFTYQKFYGTGNKIHLLGFDIKK